MQEQRNGTGIFIAATFILSWLLLGSFIAAGGNVASGAGGSIMILVTFIPGIVAIAVQKFIAKGGVKKPFALYFKPNRWFLLAWLLPVAVILAVNEVGLSLPGHEYSPEMEGFFQRLTATKSAEEIEAMRTGMNMLPIPLFWLSFIQGIVIGPTAMMLITLLSEMAFRGFLVDRFKTLGFWLLAIVIGLVWGVWSAPTALTGAVFVDTPVVGMGMFIAYSLLITPIVLWIRLRARSVVASAVFMGTIAGMANIPYLHVVGGSDLTVGVTGLAGLIVFALVDCFIALHEGFIADVPIMEHAFPEKAQDTNIAENTVGAIAVEQQTS